MRYQTKSHVLHSMINDWQQKFVNGTDRDKFLFIQKYLRTLEDHLTSLYNACYTYNPLTVNDVDKKELAEIERTCLTFLTVTAKGGKSVMFQDSPHALAQAFLGVVHELGAFSLPENLENAQVMYLAASRMNNPLATYRLAQLYEKDIKKTRNIPKALTFYRYAAKLGCIEALHTYGCLVIHGELGMKPDVSYGMTYLKMAVKMANKIYPHPYFDLAQCYEYNNIPPEDLPDEKYTFTMYEKGAHLGDANCQYRVGCAYEYGHFGQPKNYPLALEWYREAASKYQVEAMFKMAQVYYTGVDNIIERNYDLAYDYALKAGARGHIGAAFLLTEYSENGIGTQKDNLAALWWYCIAQTLGGNCSKTKMNELKQSVGRPVIPSLEKKKCNIC